MPPFDTQRSPGGGFWNNWGGMNPAGYMPPTPEAGLLYAPPVATGADLTSPLAGTYKALQPTLMSTIGKSLSRFMPGGGAPADSAAGDSATNPAATGLGWNVGTGQLAMSGIQTVAGIWAALQAQKQAKAEFAFNKGLANTNIANSISAYNTQLDSIARSRGRAEGQSASEIASYIEANKARDARRG